MSVSDASVMWAVCVASALGLSCTWAAPSVPSPLPGVEVEELVYTFEPANNGAGPLWCFGSTCLVRVGEDVFVSGLETLKDVQPLHNVRWLLFKRGDRRWELQCADGKGRQREPCPLAGSWDGRLYLSSNPTLTAPGTRNGPAQPQILEFAASNPRGPHGISLPRWEGEPAFTEHSYRAFAADGPRGELLLLNVLGHQAQYWSFRDRDGTWAKCGKLTFPMGHDYEEPEPIRLCYPVVALRNREAHVMAISDIIEPVKAWREYKLILNKGRRWDYDFRRLFYTWTPDIARVPFSPWVEIASREETAGHITQLDLWLDSDGRAHLLWLDRTVKDRRMREKFFPNVRMTTSLVHGLVQNGKLVQRTVLAIGGEGESSVVPGYARFHATPDGRLFVFYYCSGTDEQGQGVAENRVMEVFSDGTHREGRRVPLACPFTAFMTATERGGSRPSEKLEVIGVARGREGISYARIPLFKRIIADFQTTLERGVLGSRATFDASQCISIDGKIVSWEWAIDGTTAKGPKVVHDFHRSGEARVSLTVTDDRANAETTVRTVRLPVSPADFGLEQWGLALRTEAETFARNGGGTVLIRDDKLAASALSFSHWDPKGIWLEWDVEIPRDDDYFLLIRYAVPKDAARLLTIDGAPGQTIHFPASGGYGSAAEDNWSFATLRDEAARTLTLRLAAGLHRIRLENQDGRGLNLDYLEWVPKSRALTADEVHQGLAGPTRIVIEGSFRYAIPLYGTICSSQLRSDGGHCYIASLGAHFPGDGLEGQPPSKLQLSENGKAIGPAHAAHVDIREKGLGRYSHWHTSLRFSATDNSDPRSSGRTYTWEISGR